MRYSDLGGIERVLEEIRDLVERPFRYPELYKHLGVEPPRGILLHGAPGSGKTSLAMAIAGELSISLLKVSAPELVSGMSGESEGRIRELFEQAKLAAPCLLFLDEIDAITPKRETAQREMERRIVAQLLTCMDDLGRSSAMVMVVGATNRPDSLDPALRRAGRFDRELQLSIPNEDARMRILQVLTAKIRLSGSINLNSIARNTPGFVGADLKALTQEAANVAIRRIFSKRHYQVAEGLPEWRLSEEELQLAAIEPNDFDGAMSKIQPSAKREGFAVAPNTKWEDIGALSYVRDELRMAVVEPIRHPEMFAAVGITAPAGVLLWGPPGCGKTLLAKAIANESHSNFISVKGPELLNKYVGESERAVRQVFERARHSAPCVVFFDELDALCPRRTDEADSATSRVVNQLLTEMDGLESRRQVFILAATNRPDMIDPAMTRPGRLDKMLYVNLPTPSERAEILQAVGRGTPWASDVDLVAIAHSDRCCNFSGADLAALVREASLAAVREAIGRDNLMQLDDQIPNSGSQLTVSMIHIEAAVSRVSPSVSHRDMEKYERLHKERMDRKS
jgi:ribosome biogenesis ATPase